MIPSADEQHVQPVTNLVTGCTQIPIIPLVPITLLALDNPYILLPNHAAVYPITSFPVVYPIE